eukprot:6484281-Amphidinium_carterae.1
MAGDIANRFGGVARSFLQMRLEGLEQASAYDHIHLPPPLGRLRISVPTVLHNIVGDIIGSYVCSLSASGERTALQVLSESTTVESTNSDFPNVKALSFF